MSTLHSSTPFGCRGSESLLPGPTDSSILELRRLKGTHRTALSRICCGLQNSSFLGSDAGLEMEPVPAPQLEAPLGQESLFGLGSPIHPCPAPTLTHVLVDTYSERSRAVGPGEGTWGEQVVKPQPSLWGGFMGRWRTPIALVSWLCLPSLPVQAR